MSVRRLAEVQPERFAFTPENEARCAREIAKYPEGRQASAVIALLWLAQQQNGHWLTKPAIEKVAAMLGMPDIRVLEIATFYSMFNLAPVGKYFIQFCGTTPCVLAGADAIKSVLMARVGPAGHVTADGLFSWCEVECLGACCNAPMVQINDDYYEDLTAENFNALLDKLAAGRPVKAGSQIGRTTSEPVGGLTSLTSLYGVDGRSGSQTYRGAPSGGNEAAADRVFAVQDADAAPGAPAAERLNQERRENTAKPSDSIAQTGSRHTGVGISQPGKGASRKAAAKAPPSNLQNSQPSAEPGLEPNPDKS
jgi:NADH-quinone oxidoreductase subunit E